MRIARIAALALALAGGQLLAQPYGYHQAPASPPLGSADIKITSPWHGAVIPGDRPIVVDFDADPGGQGDHLHLYVDGNGPVILRQLAGSYELGNLPPGHHVITMLLVDAQHQPTGIEKSISIRVRPETPPAPSR